MGCTGTEETERTTRHGRVSFSNLGYKVNVTDFSSEPRRGRGLGMGRGESMYHES